jgi:hypothetical protein
MLDPYSKPELEGITVPVSLKKKVAVPVLQHCLEDKEKKNDVKNLSKGSHFISDDVCLLFFLLNILYTEDKHMSFICRFENKDGGTEEVPLQR